MFVLKEKNVLVVGLGTSGQAACDLLLKRGAKVTAVDSGDSEPLRRVANQLHARGIAIELGAAKAPSSSFDLVVVSPGVPPTLPLMRELRERKAPIIGELELGYQQSSCLNVAITGTNGKTTTTELIELLLKENQRKTVAAGNIGTPVCAVVDQTKELDWLTLEVSSFQLETIEFFRPAIAVFLNFTPDHLDRYADMGEYLKAKARIFENQQAFDTAIIQREALTQLEKHNLRVPAKIITFSATDQSADLYLDRGLLVSRLDGWSGVLLDMSTCKLRGPHNAENLMAALAVGRVMRLPLEGVVQALRSYRPKPHRCELVAEINGVQFINDSKATNPDAVQKALLSVPTAFAGAPNVWLIAGGKDKGFDYHDLGPLLSKRVKGAFLLGETREKIRSSWGLFTPCAVVDSLLEAVSKSAASAVSGDVVLLSPACSSFDMFQNYQHRGDVFRQAVEGLVRTANSGAPAGDTTNSGARQAPVADR